MCEAACVHVFVVVGSYGIYVQKAMLYSNCHICKASVLRKSM